MDKAEARLERARLQDMLDAYEAGRLTRHSVLQPGQAQREVTPDRADNVRARIARLDRIIGGIEEN